MVLEGLMVVEGVPPPSTLLVEVDYSVLVVTVP